MIDPLRLVAAGEAATGVALALFPRLVVELLFGGTEAGATGLAMSRVGGMALLAMGIACWPTAGASGAARARAVLLVYSAPVTIYLGALAMDGELRGALLWPAVVVHVVVTAVLAMAMVTKRG